jgi:hypothetical protein
MEEGQCHQNEPIEDVDRWLKGNSVEDALAMQKPASDDALEVGRAAGEAGEEGGLVHPI